MTAATPYLANMQAEPMAEYTSIAAVNNSPARRTEAMSNVGSSTMTPPAYTPLVEHGESSLDAEAVSDEKIRPLAQPPQPPQQQSTTSRDPALLRVEQSPPEIPLIPFPTHSHYLAQPVTTAALVSARRCSILPNRVAVWLVKRKKMALSPLAAAVLIKEGLLRPKDLELISQYSGPKRDPIDPVSGLLLGFYDYVSEMSLGLVAGPLELGRQVTSYEARRDGIQQVTVGHFKGVSHAAGKVALSTGKGLGHLVTASLKSPMLFTHNLTRGFHNMPKLYGEEVRQYKNITGLGSGLGVAAKSFGYGVGDGMKDLLAKPVDGAEQNGVVGFTTGIFKGIANAAIKPVAGGCGLIGYSSVGVYQAIRNLKISDKKDPAELVQKIGEHEYASATDTDKLFVVRAWCQTMMRPRN